MANKDYEKEERRSFKDYETSELRQTIAEPNEWLAHKAGFMDGAKWTMNLPLNDRLTDTEKADVKSIYAEAQGWLNEKHGNTNTTLRAIAVCLQDRLDRIFGKELFKDIGK